jgi:hypothetical protein
MPGCGHGRLSGDRQHQQQLSASLGRPHRPRPPPIPTHRMAKPTDRLKAKHAAFQQRMVGGDEGGGDLGGPARSRALADAPAAAASPRGAGGTPHP